MVMPQSASFAAYSGSNTSFQLSTGASAPSRSSTLALL